MNKKQMIEDEELRNLFKTESEEHLRRLEAGILHWEKHGADSQHVEELLREIHTLKGDARMLGVKDVETLAHQIEHLLSTIQPIENTLASEISDRLYYGLDAIRQLTEQAVTGEAANVNTFYVLAYLMGAGEQGGEGAGVQGGGLLVTSSVESEIVPSATDEPETVIIVQSPEAETSFSSPDTTLNPQADSCQVAITDSTPPTSLIDHRIDTIRVETRSLDTLITKAGELTVTKIRIAHQLEDIEELVTLWEEWSREWSINRLALNLQLSALPHTISDRLQTVQHRTQSRLERLGVLVNRLKSGIADNVARLDVITDELDEGIRTLRLLPLSTIFDLFPRMVRDLAKQEGKEIELMIEGGATKVDKRILEEIKDPLMHLIRNCIDHGIESPTVREQLGKPPVGTIHLAGYQSGNTIVIEVGDDGQGLDTEKIKQAALQHHRWRTAELNAMTPSQIQSLIFTSGFSTRTQITEVSGRGVGLDVVRAKIERLKGSIFVESKAGMKCTFRIQLSTTITTTPMLLVEVNTTAYALPVEFVQTTCLVSQTDIFTLEGRDTIALDGQPLSVARLADLLELPPSPLSPSSALFCVILKVGEEQLGVFVDALLDQQDVILKPQSQLLKRVRNVAGATILSTGDVCIVLNASDLIKSVQKQAVSLTPTQAIDTVPPKLAILLAEDSIATRTQQKRILETAGYEVVTAVDGLDALHKLQTRDFDAVVSDVQMPNLDGFSLVARIRQQPRYNELPIILVTSLASDEDKQRGAKVGANAYITKGDFNQAYLLETLQRLV